MRARHLHPAVRLPGDQDRTGGRLRRRVALVARRSFQARTRLHRASGNPQSQTRCRQATARRTRCIERRSGDPLRLYVVAIHVRCVSPRTRLHAARISGTSASQRDAATRLTPRIRAIAMNLADTDGTSRKTHARFSVERWGALPGGDAVRLFTLRNAHGMKVAISDLGATLVVVACARPRGPHRRYPAGPRHARRLSRGPTPSWAGLIGRWANRIAASALHARRHELHARSQ